MNSGGTTDASVHISPKYTPYSILLCLYVTWLCTEVFLIPNPWEASGGLKLKLRNDCAKALQCWVDEHNLCFENTLQHTHSCTCTRNKSGWSNINSTKMFPGSLQKWMADGTALSTWPGFILVTHKQTLTEKSITFNLSTMNTTKNLSATICYQTNNH